MRISAVIPSYNRLHQLVQAVESILEQTSAVDEIIVVDDGSSDDSYATLQTRFPDIKLIQQTNQGVSAARNRGIEQAQYEWIALLDSDDCWKPDKIATIRAEHQLNPDYVLYHSDEIWIRRGKRVNPMKKHQKTGGWIFNQCLPLCVISPSAVVIKKSVFTQIGQFDESLPACEDYDLWLRICHRYPVCYIDRPLLIKNGGHDDQLSQRYTAMDQFRIRSLDQLLQHESLSPENFESALEMLLSKLEILLKGALRHDNQAIIDEFTPIHQRWLEHRAVTC